MASTWPSCVEAPIQRMCFGLCAFEGLRIFGCGIRDACACSPAPLVGTCLKIDGAYRNWHFSKFKVKLNPRLVLPTRHSLQGHPESGKMCMILINKILKDELAFSSAVHGRCIYKKIIRGQLVLILRQVDDALMPCKDESMAREITGRIGKLIAFDAEIAEKDYPIEFFGLAGGFNGVGIDQFQDRIRVSARKCINRFLKAHGWGALSGKEKSDGSVEKPIFKDSMAISRPVSPLSQDSVEQMFKQAGPLEHSAGSWVLI